MPSISHHPPQASTHTQASTHPQASTHGRIRPLTRPKRKMSRRLRRWLRHRGHDTVITALEHCTRAINYFDFSATPQCVSYLKIKDIPHDKPHLIYDKDYRYSYGYRTRLGKLLAMQSQIDIPQYIQVSVMAGLWRAYYADNITIKLERDIYKAYHHQYYDIEYSDGGSLHTSCMRHASCMDYLHVYQDLIRADKLRVLVARNRNTGLVLARALLWLNVAPNGRDYLDRIYAVNDNMAGYMADYGREQEYYVRAYDGTPDMTVHHSIDDSELMPYMDSFCHYDLRTSELIANGNMYSLEDRACMAELQSTEGTELSDLTDHDVIACPQCGDYTWRNCMSWSDALNDAVCKSCHQNAQDQRAAVEAEAEAESESDISVYPI